MYVYKYLLILVVSMSAGAAIARPPCMHRVTRFFTSSDDDGSWRVFPIFKLTSHVTYG